MYFMGSKRFSHIAVIHQLVTEFEMFQSRSSDSPAGHRIREIGHRLIRQLEINDGFDVLRTI
jgi:hypothetical protein